MIDEELRDREDERVVTALREIGVDVESVYDLVNIPKTPEIAIPLLLELLPTVKEDDIKEGVVRALTEKSARGIAARPMLDEFVAPNISDCLRWAIGSALSVVTDYEHVDEMLKLVTNAKYGAARQMVVDGLGRFKKRPDIVDVLIDLLDDEDVSVHAMLSLRKLKATKARPKIIPLLKHERPLVRREATKTLKLFDKLEKKS